MKRIAIFCDGTWNRSDAPHPTNVVKIAQSVRPTAEDGRPQVVFYHRGVGTGAGTGRASKALDRLLGGAFGAGLTENLRDAYQSLVFAYEPGDEIHLFGFSRGAYTARSLAGMMRASGILDPAQVGAIPEFLARYRSRDPATKPDSEESFAFRARYATRVATSAREAAWRRQRGVDGLPRLAIRYVGVWDTVGALGVPSYLSRAARLVNWRYEFHDTALSRSVEAARHAVALDERRRAFPPTLWDNIDELNATAGAEGARPYRQAWFPGDHGSVGGGGDVVGLSNAALLWIAEGAAEQGLAFDAARLAAFRAGCDHRVSLRNVSKARFTLLNALSRVSLADREGPGDPRLVAPPAVARYFEAPENLYEKVPYRPGSLARVAGRLSRPPEGPG